MTRYKELYQFGASELERSGVEEAGLDARLLLETVCGTDRNTLLVHGDREVTEEEENLYRRYIERRAKREPLQHITGVQEFMGLEFSVTEDVLIPRQDTEILVEEVMRYLRDGMRILDLCTGSGCILLSLLKYSNDCIGTGSDLSEKALAIAEKNARKLGLSAKFVHSDLFEQIEGEFEYIVSNPPYIPTAVIGELQDEVKKYDPYGALDGGIDGLDFYRQIVKQAPEHLCSGGMLFFEIGYDQAEAVSKLLRERGLTEITVCRDYAGLDRVVHATWP